MKNKFTDFIRKIKINERTINYVLIFVLGFLVGIAAKTEAKKRVTIGYQDYLASGMKQDFAIGDISQEPAEPQQNQPEESEQQTSPEQIPEENQ